MRDSILNVQEYRKGMELSLNDLQHARRTLKRTPPPKAPLSPSPGQNGAAAPSNSGPSSVALFRNKFEQKQTPPSKGHIGSSPCQDGGQPSEEKVISVASAKAKFEQKSFVKSAPPWKQSSGNQSGASSSILDKSSNACKGEPPRKTLPAYFKIGTAPSKPAKPDHLKFRLRKFQDKIMLANGVTTAAITSKEEEEFEENEDTYDDVASVLGHNLPMSSASAQLVQYVVVRGDLLRLLSWPTGAVVAQACHASTAILWMHRNDSNTLQYTADLDNMHKVILEAPGQEELEKLSQDLSANQIDHKLWIEQPENYPTCLATKPYPKQQIQSFFKKLKLFK